MNDLTITVARERMLVLVDAAYTDFRNRLVNGEWSRARLSEAYDRILEAAEDVVDLNRLEKKVPRG